MIKRDWIKRYDQLPTRTASSYIVQSWDTAIKTEAEHSFSVCTTWLVHEGKFCLVDVLRGRFDYPTLKGSWQSLTRRSTSRTRSWLRIPQSVQHSLIT